MSFPVIIPSVSVQMIGLSHNTNAPVAVRERIAFTAPGSLERATQFLAGRRAETGAEFVLLSTCNRTELYLASATTDEWDTEAVTSLLFALHEVATGETASETARLSATFLQERRGHRAIEQIFRVAAGLDSMVLGENDIVRQVKDTYAQANKAGTCGTVLHTVFHEAFRVGKRARTETELGRGAFSVGHAAAELAESIHGSLKDKTVLVLGAGAMSETTARHLSAAGAATILVANRTYDKAVVLAESLNGRAVRYDEFPTYLQTADIVVASTASPHPVVTKAMVADAVKRRSRNTPLYLIDIALPRDIESSVGDLDGVYLFDLDHLQQMVEVEAVERRQKATKADAIVREEAVACALRLRTMQVAGPLVKSVRARHNAIVQAELADLRRKLVHLPESDWARIERAFESVENKLAHAPTERIKEYATFADENLAHRKMRTVRELFGIEDDPVTPGREGTP
ncbi:MAG: glutamyl-tRNA reductase [Fibrella sp.]|nr:glutamyl-tRNA reductase [Armatimonadota bacterium]